MQETVEVLDFELAAQCNMMFGSQGFGLDRIKRIEDYHLKQWKHLKIRRKTSRSLAKRGGSL